jgi:hypothetical protein
MACAGQQLAMLVLAHFLSSFLDYAAQLITPLFFTVFKNYFLYLIALTLSTTNMIPVGFGH